MHFEITRQILEAFFAVHKALGFGFVESVYAAALERRLRALGLDVAREKAIQVIFDGEPIAFQRLDFVVNDTVVVELKATATLMPYAERQLLNYLRATDLEVGLLLHFGPKAWFKRVVWFNGPRPDNSGSSGSVRTSR